MTIWAFYPALMATLLSVIGLSRIAFKYHDKQQPRTLSELAAAQEPLLNRFRTILWICGTLFALTVYGYICPRIDHAALLITAWTLTYVGNLLAAVIPARDKKLKLHNICAQAMGIGMVVMTYWFWLNLHSVYAGIEAGISLAMTLLVVLTFADRSRYIFYELSFIFLSHASILVAVFAL